MVPYIGGKVVQPVHIFHVVVQYLHPIAPGMKQGKATLLLTNSFNKRLNKYLVQNGDRNLTVDIIKTSLEEIGCINQTPTSEAPIMLRDRYEIDKFFEDIL